MELKQFLTDKVLSDNDFFKASRVNLSKNRQHVWHAISIKNIIEILDSMELKPYTSHRYWPDGKRRKESDPDYEDSYWMYGWSTTRKKEYAMNWNSVVFELDIESISTRFKVKPFSWNFLFNHKTNNRKEYEEFIISEYVAKSHSDLKQEDIDKDNEIDRLFDLKQSTTDIVQKELYQKQIDELYEKPTWFSRWQESHGKSINLNKCLKGIYLDKSHLDIYGKDHPACKKIMEHPMFKGLFVAPQDKKEIKKKVSP